MKKNSYNIQDIVVKSVLGLLIAIMIALLVFIIDTSHFHYFNFRKQIGVYHDTGDAIGGMTAPIVGLISALLVYLSFRQQLKANNIILNSQHEGSLNNYLRKYITDVSTVMRELWIYNGGRANVKDDLSQICYSCKKIQNNQNKVVLTHNNLIIPHINHHEMTNDTLIVNSKKSNVLLRDFIFFLNHGIFFLKHLDKLTDEKRNNGDILKLYFEEFEFLIKASFYSNAELIASTEFKIEKSTIYLDLLDAKSASKEFVEKFQSVKGKIVL